MELANVWSALRVRVSPCAGLMLDWITERCGPLVLVHSLETPGTGSVKWHRRMDFRPSSGELSWCALEPGMLYVRESDLHLLRDAQLVIDVAFGADPYSGAVAEARLVSLLRPFSESELELLESAAELEARAAIERAARGRRGPA